MSYRTYNTRNSNGGRYNSGQFVSAGELSQQAQYSPAPAQQGGGGGGYGHSARPPITPDQRINDMQFQDTQRNDIGQNVDVDMRQEEEPADAPPRPAWMKSKLDGVKKIAKKERRRRQNNNLRRLITPKNALMVLNEMIPEENIAANFKVEQGVSFNNKPNSFCADLELGGVIYKGYGDNKLMARNAAAEQAIRDLILKNMNNPSAEDDSSPLPMLQIASFALHKLFAEWQLDGHRLPAKRTQTEGGAPVAKPPRALPVNAAQLHPCMLLTYLRPNATYRLVPAPPAPHCAPLQPSYTMAVDVDGETWTGTATNKKEARRLAAKAVCEQLFGVAFDPAPSSNVPMPPQ